MTLEKKASLETMKILCSTRTRNPFVQGRNRKRHRHDFSNDCSNKAKTNRRKSHHEWFKH